MSEETKIRKPQAPLMRGSDYILPLTTADQIILADGTRLEKDGKIVVDKVKGISGDFVILSVLAANWMQQEDGSWAQVVNVEGITSETRGRYADLDLSEATPATYVSLEKAWLRVSTIRTVDGGIQFVAFKDVPDIDMSVTMEVLM